MISLPEFMPRGGSSRKLIDTLNRTNWRGSFSIGLYENLLPIGNRHLRIIEAFRPINEHHLMTCMGCQPSTDLHDDLELSRLGVSLRVYVERRSTGGEERNWFCWTNVLGIPTTTWVRKISGYRDDPPKTFPASGFPRYEPGPWTALQDNAVGLIEEKDGRKYLSHYLCCGGWSHGWHDAWDDFRLTVAAISKHKIIDIAPYLV